MIKKHPDKVITIVALFTIILAGILGLLRETGDMKLELANLIREGEALQSEGENQYIISDARGENHLAYFSIETAAGYGGDLASVVRVDTLGTIENVYIIRHRETPSFLKKVKKNGLIRQLSGVSYSASFDREQGIDVITGATYTSEAIIECARLGSRKVAEASLGYVVPQEASIGFSVGVPEIALILLYLLALIGVYSKFPYKKGLRWFTMTGGLVVLGFWFAVPLTLSRINLFLLGFWPDWHDQLYWYILVFGFFLVLLVTRKNIYCSWICPLGCLQEGLGLIGGAKSRFSRRFNRIMRWLQRIVAWLAVVLALYFRNPVKLNYEIFGVTLSFTGATYLVILACIFLVASLFIKRAWCNYACPVTVVEDLVRILGRKKARNS